MKKWLLSLILCFGSHSFAALTGDQVLAFQGKYTDAIFKNKDIQDLIIGTLTATSTDASASLRTSVWADLNDSMQVIGPAQVADNRYLVIHGCQAHNCGGGNRVRIFIDALNPQAALIVRRNMIDFTAGSEAVQLSISGVWSKLHGASVNGFPSSIQNEISNM